MGTEEDVSTEWWGKMCVDKSYRQPISVNWWSPRRWCRNLDGDRILKIAAKFWSDDDLIFQVDTGYMEPGRNTCVYRPGRRWNYRGNSWKEINFEFQIRVQVITRRRACHIDSCASGPSP